MGFNVISLQMETLRGPTRTGDGIAGSSADDKDRLVRGTVAYEPQLVLDSHAALTIFGRSVTVSPGTGPEPEPICDKLATRVVVLIQEQTDPVAPGYSTIAEQLKLADVKRDAP
jgi:hypothetical protein